MSFTMLTSEGFLTLSFGRSSVFGEAQLRWQVSCESLQCSWAEVDFASDRTLSYVAVMGPQWALNLSPSLPTLALTQPESLGANMFAMLFRSCFKLIRQTPSSAFRREELSDLIAGKYSTIWFAIVSLSNCGPTARQQLQNPRPMRTRMATRDRGANFRREN
jgi:hypothetical protein